MDILGKFVRDEDRIETNGRNQAFVGNEITHPEYRTLVLQRAIKMSGGKTPSTKEMYKAKADIDKALGNSGRRIRIPGAAPGRRTI